PVPEQLKLIFERLRAVPKAMLDEVRNQLTGLARALAEAAKTWFKDAFCTAVEQQQLGGVLFGKPLTCADLANPAAALDRVADSLLAKAIAEPVAELISALLLWLEPAKALLALRGTQAEALIVARLQEAVEIVAARLKAPVSGDDADIRDPRRQQQFVEAIRGDLDRLLTPSEVTIEAVAAHAKTGKVALEAWVAAGLREQVDRLKTALRPNDAGELDALFEAVRHQCQRDRQGPRRGDLGSGSAQGPALRLPQCWRLRFLRGRIRSLDPPGSGLCRFAPRSGGRAGPHRWHGPRPRGLAGRQRRRRQEDR